MSDFATRRSCSVRLPDAARAVTAALLLVAAATAQGGVQMLWSNPWSNYTTVASRTWTSPASDLEAADDFDLQGTITRVVFDAFGCFQCAPPVVTGATVRFYDSVNGNPGTLLQQTWLPAGAPGLLLDPLLPATVEMTLPTPFLATGRHFVSMQLHFQGSGYWDIWVSSMNAPQFSPVRVRDRLANGPWTPAPLGPWTTSPLWADLTFQLWGTPVGGGGPVTTTCVTWSELPTTPPPGTSYSLLRGIAAFAPGDVWAAGAKIVGPIGQTEQHTFVTRWDGSAWTEVPSPNPAPAPGMANLTLWAIDGTSSSDVWAAGSFARQIAGGWVGQQVFAMHWDGTTWSVPSSLPVPNSGIGGGVSGSRVLDVEAEASNDVWFVGDWIDLVSVSSGVSTRPGLLLRWDGSTLAQTVLPIVSGVGHQYFEAVAALGPNDVWVAGGAGTTTLPGTAVPVLFHFDGSQWTHVPCPTPNHPGWRVNLVDVQMAASNEVYVLGVSSTTTQSDTFVARWNGSAWSLLPPIPVGVTAIAAVSATELYGVGSAVWRFDGTAWTQTQAFTAQYGASLQAVDALGPCQVFAAGGQQRIGQVAPFAARLDTGAYGHGGVRLPTVPDRAPATMIPVAPPVIGTTLLVGVDDPTHALGVNNALILWLLATSPAPGYPAPLPIPFGGRNDGPGELFIDPTTIGYTAPLVPWVGGPLVLGLPIPNNPAFVGADIYSQAAFLDLATGLRVVVTNGLDLHVGN
jgi:hypothetical protein